MMNIVVFLLLTLATTSVLALTIYHDPDPVVARSDESFTVEWTTDIAALSTISYGLQVPPDQQTQNNSFVRAHRLKVEGLQPGRDYYYSILSISEDGQAKIDDNRGNYYKTTTRPKLDITPPIITNISVDVSDQTAAVVRWLTNEPATSQVFYGEQGYTDSAEDVNLGTEHEVRLSTTPNTQYVFVAGSCDAAGNCVNSSKSGFVAGTGLIPLNVTIPEFTRGNTITIKGNTVAGAEVRVFIGGTPVRALRAGADGGFLFSDVAFEGSTADIKITVRDASGQTREASFTTVSDSKPPVITLSKPLPAYAPDAQLTVTGTVDEQATIVYGVQHTTVAPVRVTGLKSTGVTANSITLVWDPIQGITHYAVYRNNQRVAVVTAATAVDSVSPGEIYNYRVSAVADDCTEGPYSATVSVSSLAGGLKVQLPTVETPLGCGEKTQSIEAKGAFTLTLTLKDGSNDVLIEARDRAGNVGSVRGVVVVDTKPPQFLSNNLAELSPSYTSEVTVRGQLNKAGTVFIYVNNNKPIATLTDANGNFQKQIPLERDQTLQTTQAGGTTVSGEITQGWTNKVTLEGVDQAGRKIRVGPTPVLYSVCGFGSDFAVNLGKPLPDVLTPRLLLEGVAEAGFWVNVSYRGKLLDRPPTIAVSLLPVSAGQAKNYDNDWVTRPALLQNPRKPGEGYVQFLFSPPGGTQNTTSSNEDVISKHRLGKCKVPAFGCIKLLVAVDVTADEKVPNVISNPLVQGTQGTFTIRKLQQRTCIDMELQIDRSLELSKNIPHKLLDFSIGSIDAILNGINKVLDPLITVGTYTTYGCMAMNGVLYGMYFSEHMSCDYATVEGQGVIALLTKWIGGTDTLHDIASIGVCEQVFKGVGKQTADTNRLSAFTACEKCQAAIAKRKTLEEQMRLVCDRVACPSAPTLQTYIKDFQKQGVKPVAIRGVDVTPVHNSVNGILYTGSSCGFNGQGGRSIAIGYTSAAAPTTYSIAPGAGGNTIVTNPVTGSTVMLDSKGNVVKPPAAAAAQAALTADQIAQMKKDMDAISLQIKSLQAQPASPENQARIDQLTTQRTQLEQQLQAATAAAGGTS
jgi:hypothetical protein